MGLRKEKKVKTNFSTISKKQKKKVTNKPLGKKKILKKDDLIYKKSS